MNSNIIRVGSESRSETKTYTEKERDSLGRDLADLQSQINGTKNQINGVYAQREQELLALEKQKSALEKQAEALSPAILKGTVTEVYQCDVYEDGQNRIVVRSGFQPTDPAGLVETTALVKSSPETTQTAELSEIETEEETEENI